MKEICEWLKHQVRLAGSPVRDRVRPGAHTPENRQTRRPKTPQSRPTRRYTFELDTPSSEKKRKISWDDILHPFKARRLEKEERKPLHTVRGTFSVTDIQGAKFPGKQTTATSLCAILQSKTLAPSLWTTEVVDRLLLQGDKLHSTRVYHLQKHKSGSTDLKPSELPDKIAVSEREFSLRYSRVSKNRRKRGSGKSNKKTKEEPSNQSRQKKLSTLLKLSLDSTHAGVLLTANKITMGIFVEDAYLYFFHPCKVTNNLFAVNDYEAVLSKFRDTDHLATYLCHKFVKDDSSYNLDVVDFNIEFDMWTEISFSAKMPTV